MIITRAPLRITLGGGGTDVPAYYEKHGGLCLAAAIDKYVYIALHERFDDWLVVKYSEVENVADVSELKHPIVREALKLCGLDGKGMEVVSFADIPAGTGLGSSSSFTVALLKALYAWLQKYPTAYSLAGDACEIELGRLKCPIGKQDQYIAALGGMAKLVISGYWPKIYNLGSHDGLADNLMLFYTGYTRSASDILASSHKALNMGDPEHTAYLHHAKARAVLACDAIMQGNLAALGSLFSEHWDEKRKRDRMSNRATDAMYDYAMKNGALGGKLVGAGGGGFFLFVTEDKWGLSNAMASAGHREVEFTFDYDGVKLLTT